MKELICVGRRNKCSYNVIIATLGWHRAIKLTGRLTFPFSDFSREGDIHEI